jgi:organic hydroperoxide reductase OsmC/OhrA
MDNLIVNIHRTNQKVHFEAISDRNPGRVIPFDYAPPVGDGDGFAGLELLLASFAGCVSTTIVFLLGRMGKQVSSYDARAEGVRSERPLALREIHLHLRLRSEGLTDAGMAEAIRQAEAVSPVWQAVKGNLAVTVTYELQ